MATNIKFYRSRCFCKICVFPRAFLRLLSRVCIKMSNISSYDSVTNVKYRENHGHMRILVAFYVWLYLEHRICIVISECICCGQSRLCHFYLLVHVSKYYMSFPFTFISVKLILETYKHEYTAYTSGIIATWLCSWIYLLQLVCHDESTSPDKNGLHIAWVLSGIQLLFTMHQYIS